MSYKKGLSGGIGTGTHTINIWNSGSSKGKIPGRRRNRKNCIYYSNGRCIKKGCPCSGPTSPWCKWYCEKR